MPSHIWSKRVLLENLAVHHGIYLRRAVRGNNFMTREFPLCRLLLRHLGRTTLLRTFLLIV